MNYLRILLIFLACSLSVGGFAQPQDFTSVAKKAIPATVYIKVKSNETRNPFADQFDSRDPFGNDFFRFFFSPRMQQQPSIGQASGFIVSADGHIVTNSHVVKDTSEISVMLQDGRELPGRIVGQDSNTDIAIVKINADNLPYLEFGDSDALQIGQWAIAIGNPLGLQATLTVGVVSAKGRNNLDLATYEEFIQTDAALNRGNSGGPLLDINSKVIGMNTAIVTGYGGIGFAIPSNMISRIMDQIIKSGKVTRGFIGVSLQDVDQELAQAFDWKQNGGALIADVSKGSPAEKAGLQQGDIIQSYNGIPVTDMITFRNSIALSPPGTKISLTISRKGRVLEILLMIGDLPDDPQSAEAPDQDNQLGIEVQDLTPDNARLLGLEMGSGVLVSSVSPNSLADLGGLKKGALILEVNQKKVSTTGQFNAALKETPAGKPLLLLIKQGGSIRFLSIKIN